MSDVDIGLGVLMVLAPIGLFAIFAMVWGSMVKPSSKNA